LPHLTQGGLDQERAVLVDRQVGGTLDPYLDLGDVGAGVEADVVLEAALLVIGPDLDAGIEPAVADLGVARHLRLPALRIVAEEVVVDAGKLLAWQEAGGAGGDEAHVQRDRCCVPAQGEAPAVLVEEHARRTDPGAVARLVRPLATVGHEGGQRRWRDDRARAGRRLQACRSHDQGENGGQSKEHSDSDLHGFQRFPGTAQAGLVERESPVRA
jgi:hypothetical protein